MTSRTARNPIGIISMQYARPFTAEHFPVFETWKAIGFDFVELLVPEPSELDLTQVGRALADAGLDVVLAARVNPARDLTSEEATARAAGIDYLKRCIEVAAELGARVVGGPLYGSPLVFAGRAPRPLEAELRRRRRDWCIDGLKAVAPAAESAGVSLAVEPLNRFETDMINLASQALKVVDAVGSGAVGIMLDTFHTNMEEDDLLSPIAAAGSRLVHFQANENHRGFLGTGHLDWTGIIRQLKRSGYSGPISLEPFRRSDRSVSVPLAQWKPPAGDETRQLRASVAFLSGLIETAGGTE